MTTRPVRSSTVGWRVKNGKYLQHETFLFAIPIRRTTQQEEDVIQRYTASEATRTVIGFMMSAASQTPPFLHIAFSHSSILTLVNEHFCRAVLIWLEEGS